MNTLLNENDIPEAPVAVQTAVVPVSQLPKPKRKSYYVPVAKRVAEDNRTAVKIAHDRKAERSGKKIAKTEKSALKDLFGKPVASQKTGISDGTAICTICHKPITRGSSISQGMGDECAGKMKQLKATGKTLEQHYEALTAQSIPSGYIKFKDAAYKIHAKGISTYRILQAVGGDRMIRKPINSNFRIVIVDHVRYINGECLKHVEDLKKV